MSVKIGNSDLNIIQDNLVLHLDASSDLNYRPLLTEVEVLVVAGGGSGGPDVGGGGGAGGLIYKSSYSVTPGSPISVVVGNGGAARVPFTAQPGEQGQNSVFDDLVAIGGGGGGNYNNGSGTQGGSGGGGSGGGSGGIGALPTDPKQGNSGGNGFGGAYGAGGGGGAGSPGKPATSIVGGDGGDGLPFSISGVLTWYAGGGGGGGGNDAGSDGRGFGGRGGGGDGASRSGTYSPNITFRDGKPNTGGGGGGTGGWNTSGAGGSGVVIVRYPGPQRATGGNTIRSIGGFTIHTFTSSGTFTPLNSFPTSNLGLVNLVDNTKIVYTTGGTVSSYLNGVGSVSFDRVDDYGELSEYDPKLNFQPQNPFSVFAWIYNLGGTAGSGTVQTGAILSNMFISTNEYGTQYNGWDLWINDSSSIATHFISNWSGNAIKVGVNVNYSSYANTWAYVGFTYDGSAPTTATTTPFDFYINGSLITDTKEIKSGTDGFDYSSTPIYYTPRQRFRIASRYAPGVIGQASLFTFGAAHIYNKRLTSAEVLTNFNALRGRFGI